MNPADDLPITNQELSIAEKNVERSRPLFLILYLLLVLFGGLFLFFPFGDAPGSDYMTCIPLFTRCLLTGVLLPVCGCLCFLRTRRSPDALLREVAPRAGRALSFASAAIVGPLGLMPLILALSIRILGVLFAKTDSAVFASLWLLLLVVPSYYIATPFGQEFIYRRMLLILESIVGIALLMLVFTHLAGPNPETLTIPMASHVPLENNVGMLWGLAPLLLFAVPQKNEAPSVKQILKEKTSVPLYVSAGLALVLTITFVIYLFRLQNIPGADMGAMLALTASNQTQALLLAVFTLLIALFLLSCCRRACVPWLCAAAEGKISAQTATLLVFGTALLLSVPMISSVYSQIAASLLTALYPCLAVLVVCYTLIPQCMSPRKQAAIRSAFWAAVVWGVVMLIYQLFTRLGVSAPLFTGMYESTVLAKGHLTWVAISAIFFVIGDTHFRKQEERARYKNKN